MWKGYIVDSEYGSVAPHKITEYIENYKKIGIEVIAKHLTTDDAIVKECYDADVLMCTGNPPITRKVTEGIPNLKVVQRFGIGVNSVDLEAAKDNGVLALNLAGFCIEELAIHATALILDLIRNVSYNDRGVRQGIWRKAGGILPPSPANMTLGLYGFGGSARILGDIFHNGMGTKIITCDPYLAPEDLKGMDVELVSFDELLERSDILSVNVPLNETTHHSLNYEAFCKMKSTAMIINIARGPIINQDDLIRALNEGEIRYAGLDVYEEEPLPKDSPLCTMDNVVLTCHTAFWGEKAQSNVDVMVIEQMRSILEDNKISARCVANRGVVSKIENLEIV